LIEIGGDFVTFILNFYEEFPKYRSRELVLTGESFAGKYLSYISSSILDYNDANPDNKITIKTLILSNPLVDPPTERIH
jgi:carboxypeptidase C (cathepsin A)